MEMRFLSFLLLISYISAQTSVKPSLRRNSVNVESTETLDTSDISHSIHDTGVVTNSSSPWDGRVLTVADGEVFRPLDCNNDPCNAGETTWTRERYNPNAGTVVIPCGKCVTMDYDKSDTLALPKGLDVQGTLRFPDGYKLTMVASFVRVQGNLHMKASNHVTNKPNIKIVLTGTNTDETAFVPARNNRFACTKGSDRRNPSKCEVGKKPFVVAGGWLNIAGLPRGCPTWTHLENMVQGKVKTPKDFLKLPQPDPQHPNFRCRSLRPYMLEDFSTSENQYGWTGGYGAFFNVTERGTFRVSQRKSADDQGPLWDMMHIRDCLIPGQEYLFSARIKLSKPGVATGTPTRCTVSDQNCLVLQSKIRSGNGKFLYSRKEEVKKKQGTKYDTWFNFYATFSYTKEELDPSNIYQLLLLRGPEKGVIIEMDDVRFSLPQADTVPDPAHVCGGNLVLNGNADSSAIHPYPMAHQRGGPLSVEKLPNGNKYFHLTGRTKDYDAITYEFSAPGCFAPNGEYKVSAKIRVHSSRPVKSELVLRSNFYDGSMARQKITECPESSKSSWALCEKGLTIDPKVLNGKVKSLRLHIETVDAPTMDLDVDDVRFEGLDGPVASIIVPDKGISNCWDKGAEILITSHTLNYDDEQVRRLVSSPTPLGNGMVVLNLDSPIVAPTTRRQSPQFATEVALLSRNIVFEGQTDKSRMHGGHFIVLHTPTVQQYLEGVEFRRFGQQGVLGKYPIHFHMCGNVRGALVMKNTIRDSSQRCVVVHGTHNLTVTENVAYNTSGHCYMTEDGGEVDNVFRRNLGALTRKVETRINNDESDHEPSTFWCTNPLNEWDGNVAAGSEQNGYWFELRSEVRGPTAKMPMSKGMNPKVIPIRHFENNVAHSNRRHGFRTYPNGYLPDGVAVFSNFKSYKNREDGMFLHNSKRLIVSGGVMADNRKQIDFDRADNIQLRKTHLVGVSDEYKNVIKSQSNAPYHEEMVVGVELHGFALDSEFDGATIRDVKFSGFHDSRKVPTSLIHVDDEVRIGPFDYWSTIQGVQVADDVTAPWFDFSNAVKSGVSDIYLTDLDSSMRPPGTRATGTSTVISMSPRLTEFIDDARCHKVPEGSYMYCPNTCLRSIVYRVSQIGTKQTICRISEKGNPKKFIDIPSNFYIETFRENREIPNAAENTHFRKSRYFSAALPPGNYEAKFLDPTGKEVWPTFVEATYEKPQCENSMAVGAVKHKVPAVNPNSCRQLIRNGDLEMSDKGFPHWLHAGTALELAVGKGRKDSNAIADTVHDAPEGAIGQYLDTRCLERGRQYEIKAWVKLERRGKTEFCDGQNCPQARLRIAEPLDKEALEFDETAYRVAETFVSPHRENSWNLLQGVFTVNDRMAKAPSAFFYVQRGVAGMKMYLDEVSVTMLPKKCNELVRNGDFSVGNTTDWEIRTQRDGTKRPKLDIVTYRGNAALTMTDRGSSLDGPMQQIHTGCLKQGERYLVKAKVRLLNSNGSQFICDATQNNGAFVCPRMMLRSFADLDLKSERFEDRDLYAVAFTDHGLTPDRWQTLSGIFHATDLDANGEKSILFFDNAHGGKDYVIDDVSITYLPSNCNDLIMNGDMEYDKTARFWRHILQNEKEKIDIVTLNGNNQALRVSDRKEDFNGVHQYVDTRCLKRDTTWNLTAKMKLVNRMTGKGVSCDVSNPRSPNRCPSIRVSGWKSGKRLLDEKVFMSNSPRWQPNQLNLFKAEISVSSQLASCDRVSFGFHKYSLNWNLILDDIHITPS